MKVHKVVNEEKQKDTSREAYILSHCYLHGQHRMEERAAIIFDLTNTEGHHE